MSTKNDVTRGNSGGLRHRKQEGKSQKDSGISVKDVGDDIQRQGVWNWLADPVDPITISLFRILFSFGMIWHMVRLLRKSTVGANFNFPELNFHYPLGRDYVTTPSIQYVYLIVFATLLSSITMVVGLFTKLSAAVFLTTYVWFNALEKCRYNNHYYFYANLAFLIAVTGCGQKLSIDNLISRKTVAKNVVPRWHLCILQFMIVVCYFFAGIAKYNYDWSIRGEPMTIWASEKIHHGSLTPQMIKFIGYFLSINGLLFDTFIGFILLSPFRNVGFFFTMIFHISNHFLFKIGTFPWVMLATNILFVPPETIINIYTKCKSILRLKAKTKQSSDKQGPTDKSNSSTNNNSETFTKQSMPKVSMKVKIFLGCFVGYHLLMPLRHWMYMDHSSVNWTMTGHQFSWRMMLNDEDVLLRLHAKVDVNSEEEFIQNLYGMRMNTRQVKRMITDLDLVLQFVKYCTTQSPGSKQTPAHVKADIWKALNGRPYQRWVNSEIFLNEINPDDWSQDWILPMIPDDIIDFEELERLKLMSYEKKIPIAFFMERPNETFSTFHHDWSGCKTINVTCLTGELFYKNDLKVDAEKLVPGINVSVPLGTKYQLYTKDSPAVWMYEYDCHDGGFHVGMEMLSIPGWAAT